MKREWNKTKGMKEKTKEGKNKKAKKMKRQKRTKNGEGTKMRYQVKTKPIK
ncbi:hypothetical protein RhiirA5_437100 [Rhizophagus irregularis]|uniref:Uncharacterized protein n=1 Tax=Rhizophagus irregularis TaxID=588596 RepID=A0A2N0NKY2_9GLOM|nr:hypothetical protein RhiirA5_437100 [Rhizophagus irregularis]